MTDNQGAAEGIGSRYFTVSNGAGALTAADGNGVADGGARIGGARPIRRARRSTARRSSAGAGGISTAPLRAFEPDASAAWWCAARK